MRPSRHQQRLSTSDAPTKARQRLHTTGHPKTTSQSLPNTTFEFKAPIIPSQPLGTVSTAQEYPTGLWASATGQYPAKQLESPSPSPGRSPHYETSISRSPSPSSSASTGLDPFSDLSTSSADESIAVDGLRLLAISTDESVHKRRLSERPVLRRKATPAGGSLREAAQRESTAPLLTPVPVFDRRESEMSYFAGSRPSSGAVRYAPYSHGHTVRRSDEASSARQPARRRSRSQVLSISEMRQHELALEEEEQMMLDDAADMPALGHHASRSSLSVSSEDSMFSRVSSPLLRARQVSGGVVTPVLASMGDSQVALAGRPAITLEDVRPAKRKQPSISDLASLGLLDRDTTHLPVTSPLFSPTLPVPVQPLFSPTGSGSSSSSSSVRSRSVSDARTSSSGNRRRALTDLPPFVAPVSEPQAVRSHRSIPALPPTDHNLFDSPLICRRLRPLETARPPLAGALARQRSRTLMGPPRPRSRSGSTSSKLHTLAPVDMDVADHALAARGIRDPISDGPSDMSDMGVRRIASADLSSQQPHPRAEVASLRHSASQGMHVNRLPSISELANIAEMSNSDDSSKARTIRKGGSDGKNSPP